MSEDTTAPHPVPKRRHSTIGCLSPIEFERQAGFAYVGVIQAGCRPLGDHRQSSNVWRKVKAVTMPGPAHAVDAVAHRLLGHELEVEFLVLLEDFLLGLALHLGALGDVGGQYFILLT